MASSYSALKIELIATGEQVNVWGSTTNTNLGTALEEAIVGRTVASFTTDGNLTIDLTNTNTTQVARHYILSLTSTGALTATRDLIVPSIDKPYIIENVEGSPLINPIKVCGSSFDLKVRRHRLFESNIALQGTVCRHKEQGKPVGIYGSMRDEIPNGGKTAKTIGEARIAMGIDWAIWTELVEAIPPAFTKYLGHQVIRLAV